MCHCRLQNIKNHVFELQWWQTQRLDRGWQPALYQLALYMGYLQFNLKGEVKGQKKLTPLFTLKFVVAGKYLGASELKVVTNGTATLNCFLNPPNLKSSFGMCTGRQLCNNFFKLCQGGLFKEEGASDLCHASSRWYVLMACFFFVCYHEMKRLFFPMYVQNIRFWTLDFFWLLVCSSAIQVDKRE